MKLDVDVAVERASSEISLPALPYALDALEPYISKETLAVHYGKHHRGYVEKLIQLVRGTQYYGRSLEDIVKVTTGTIFNVAAQAWNHSFYWNCLTPDRGQTTTGRLAKAIERDFGSLNALIEEFRESATTKFGSGWTWLVINPDGLLAIQNTDDADNPLRRGLVPLLTCDVWEHAYYLDYKNERKRYIDAFLHLVNWSFVDGNFATASGRDRPFASQGVTR